jgi:hypothetical protein
MRGFNLHVSTLRHAGEVNWQYRDERDPKGTGTLSQVWVDGCAVLVYADRLGHDSGSALFHGCVPLPFMPQEVP